jgi:hypothetical protein
MTKSKDQGDDQRDLERALEKQQREDLLGDMEENRNVTGSSTWETLGDKINDENQQHGRRTQAASPREIDNEQRAANEDLK